MGREGGEKWTAAADLQPTIPKPDRLLVGAEPVGGKPNELDAMRRAEIERWAGVIKRAVIKLD